MGNKESKIWDSFSKQPEDGVSFREPVVRCDSCVKWLLVAEIEHYGVCKYCGNRRMRNLLAFNDVEMHEMIKAGVPIDFLILFDGAVEWLKHPQEEVSDHDFQGI